MSNILYFGYANINQRILSNIPVYNECQICFESYNMNNNINDICELCNTYSCLSCFETYMLTKIKDNNITIKCMCENKIAKIISNYKIKELLSRSSYDLYERIVNRHKGLNNCPKCLVEFYNEERKKVIDCANCGVHICVRCETNHQENEPCKSIIIENSKPCPKCGIYIDKIEGCDHMTCKNCKYEYSYNLSIDWQKNKTMNEQERLLRENSNTINWAYLHTLNFQEQERRQREL